MNLAFIWNQQRIPRGSRRSQMTSSRMNQNNIRPGCQCICCLPCFEQVPLGWTLDSSDPASAFVGAGKLMLVFNSRVKIHAPFLVSEILELDFIAFIQHLRSLPVGFSYLSSKGKAESEKFPPGDEGRRSVMHVTTEENQRFLWLSRVALLLRCLPALFEGREE